MEQHSNLNSPLLPVCNHIHPSGRHCRHLVRRPGDRFCVSHARLHATAEPQPDPLEELALEIGSAAEISQVGAFIAKTIQLACQNRISFTRATALTFMANSLLNAMRLANQEARLNAKEEPEELLIDFSGFPRPDRSDQKQPEQSEHQPSLLPQPALSDSHPGGNYSK